MGRLCLPRTEDGELLLPEPLLLPLLLAHVVVGVRHGLLARLAQLLVGLARELEDGIRVVGERVRRPAPLPHTRHRNSPSGAYDGIECCCCVGSLLKMASSM